MPLYPTECWREVAAAGPFRTVKKGKFEVPSLIEDLASIVRHLPLLMLSTMHCEHGQQSLHRGYTWRNNKLMLEPRNLKATA